jgi:hypothetical protein
VPESHNLLFRLDFLLHIRANAAGRADRPQHLHDFFIGAAV